jgi:hypothetical protein
MKTQKANMLLSISAMLAMATTCQVANATLYTEVGDAGQTVGTAQAAPNGTTSISGNLGPGVDGADVFSIAWGGGAFSATTTPHTFDTMLFLFDPSGNTILFNDDYNSTLASLIEHSALAAGNYLLGLSRYDNNYNGNINTRSFLDINNPNPRSYTITLNQPLGQIPEPATASLIGFGLAGIGWRSRKNNHKLKTSAA